MIQYVGIRFISFLNLIWAELSITVKVIFFFFGNCIEVTDFFKWLFTKHGKVKCTGKRTPKITETENVFLYRHKIAFGLLIRFLVGANKFCRLIVHSKSVASEKRKYIVIIISRPMFTNGLLIRDGSVFAITWYRHSIMFYVVSVII